MTTSFLPLETQLRRFVARNSTCVLEGGRKAGGPNADFRGVSLLIPFLVISFFSPCCFGLGLPGLLSIFLLCLDMFPSVSTYKVKRDLSLKPKVHWTGSGSAALRLRRLAGLCLPRFRPISGSGSLSDPPRGCEILKNCLISSVLPCRVLYVLTLSLSER